MNIILIEEKDYINHEVVRLKGRRHKHIKEILRAQKGDRLTVGRINDRVGQGQILCLEDKWVDLKVELGNDPIRPLPVQLIIALPRPPVLKRVLMTATSLGVKKIFLLHTRRVEKAFWQSSSLKKETIREQLLLGLEQAKDTVLPEVFLKKRFKPFIEDEWPLIKKDTEAYVAHPEQSIPCPVQFKKKITLAIGPEGGFIDYEIDKLRAGGFQAVHAGQRILRVETAVPYFLSRISP